MIIVAGILVFAYLMYLIIAGRPLAVFRRHYKPLSDHSDREREKLLARLNQMDRERRK